MISINFQPFNKSMTEVIEYMEKLEVLEATNKQPGTKKNDKDKSEDKTGKSKHKTENFPKKQKPKEGHSGLIILKTAELLRDSRKRNKGQLMV